MVDLKEYVLSKNITQPKPILFVKYQGPKNNTLSDFWRMIWRENVRLIVMLTNIVENGKVFKKDIFVSDLLRRRYIFFQSKSHKNTHKPF